MNADSSGPGPVVESGTPTDRTVGAYLSRQRRLRGISLEQLAQTTRIPVRSLERLESGAFDRSSDGFVRGFVRTVAEALGLDRDEAVMRLLVEPSETPSAPSARAFAARRIGVFAAAIFVLAFAVGGAWALFEFVSGDAAKPILRRDPVRVLRAEMERDFRDESRLAPPPPSVAPGSP